MRRSACRAANRSGFALLNVLVALAVLAILAGILGPMYWQQLIRQRTDATRAEMADLAAALQRFHADTGRLPAEAEGLAALIEDPGAAGWRGPYLTADRYLPVDEIAADAFGADYLYDLDPTVSPSATPDAILVSAGPDGAPDAGSVGSVWNLDAAGDDLVRLVSLDAALRSQTAVARVEMQAVADAAQAWFREHAAYPTTLADLADAYLDRGPDGDALLDPWLSAYELDPDNFSAPPTLTVSSRGPDRFDDGGGGDDLALEVSSVVPGRARTYHMIRISQVAVDARSGESLSGDWSADRTDFGLAAAFGVDGWGNLLEEAVSTRTLVSGGPDADYWTPEDNIPPGVVPDDGSGGDGIEYVDGTAVPSGNHCDQVAFTITNTSADAITITSLTVVFDMTPAFYEEIFIDGSRYANRSKPRFSSGEEVVLDASYVLPAGATVVFEVAGYTNKINASGKKMDMSGVGFDVEFSDGSSISFTAGDCL